MMKAADIRAPVARCPPSVATQPMKSTSAQAWAMANDDGDEHDRADNLHDAWHEGLQACFEQWQLFLDVLWQAACRR